MTVALAVFKALFGSVAVTVKVTCVEAGAGRLTKPIAGLPLDGATVAPVPLIFHVGDVPQFDDVTVAEPPAACWLNGLNAHDDVVVPGLMHETSRFPVLDALGPTTTLAGWQVMVLDVCANADMDAGARTRLLAAASTAAPEIRKILFMTAPR